MVKKKKPKTGSFRLPIFLVAASLEGETECDRVEFGAPVLGKERTHIIVHKNVDLAES